MHRPCCATPFSCGIARPRAFQVVRRRSDVSADNVKRPRQFLISRPPKKRRSTTTSCPSSIQERILLEQ